jgi:hypothetical protein
MLEFPSLTFPQLLIYIGGFYATGFACGAEGIPVWFRILLFICIIDTFLFLMNLTENKFGEKKI